MWKTLLLTVALGAVIDALLNWATEQKKEADTEPARWRWDAFIAILLLLKSNPKLISNKEKIKP